MNKVFYILIGALVGYYIAKNKMEKKLTSQAQKIADDVTSTVEKAVDDALAYAETNNMPVKEVRGILNGSAEIRQ